MLNIENSQMLTITKVKPWAVYFTYNNEKYLLHGTTQDYESSVRLFKRNWNGKRYELEWLSSYPSTSDNVENIFIKYRFKGKVYSQINKDKFVALLEFKDLCKGYMSMTVGRHKTLINKNHDKVNKLRSEINELNNKNYILERFE